LEEKRKKIPSLNNFPKEPNFEGRKAQKSFKEIIPSLPNQRKKKINKNK